MKTSYGQKYSTHSAVTGITYPTNQTMHPLPNQNQQSIPTGTYDIFDDIGILECDDATVTNNGKTIRVNMMNFLAEDFSRIEPGRWLHHSSNNLFVRKVIILTQPKK